MSIFKKIAEHRAEIGMILGGLCIGAGTVSACLATLKLEDIVDEHAAKVEEVKDNYISLEKVPDGDAVQEIISDAKAYKRDLTKVHAQTASKIAFTYAPTAAIFAISACFIGWSCKTTREEIKDLKLENARLWGALRGSEAILKRYRDDMREKIGEEAEQRFYNNIKTQDIEVKEVDENGKEKKKKVKGAEVINDELSGDAFIFDERCGAYVGHDINHNLYIAGLLKNQCSDNLFCNGSLMMFEILDAFGIDRDEVPGAFVRGRLSTRKGGASDTVEMNIRTVWVLDEATGEYVEKILVDPKLDGVIIDRI